MSKGKNIGCVKTCSGHVICLGYIWLMNSRLTIERVLLATDFSPMCEPAFRYAAGLARRFQARLYLLHVLPGTVKSNELGAADNEMRRLREQFLSPDDECLTAVLPGQPASRIVEKAREMGVDVIVLGAHDPSKQAEAGAADVVRQVCEQSPCPVTCVPAAPS
jgi:nucleotide-binding universal stress UspA family protein